MAGAMVTTGDVQKAKLELDRMKRSLRGWLKYRTLNDAVVAGSAPTKKPRAYAASVITQNRDMAAEQRLATQLAILIAESFPDASLPDSNVNTNPQAAVQLARIAINGPAVDAPTTQGAAWLWPVLIVGGLLLAITTAIKSSADLAAQKEQNACIEAGACTDYGFWLKAGGIAALAYVAFQMGALDGIKRVFSGKGR